MVGCWTDRRGWDGAGRCEVVFVVVEGLCWKAGEYQTRVRGVSTCVDEVMDVVVR